MERQGLCCYSQSDNVSANHISSSIADKHLDLSHDSWLIQVSWCKCVDFYIVFLKINFLSLIVSISFSYFSFPPPPHHCCCSTDTLSALGCQMCRDPSTEQLATTAKDTHTHKHTYAPTCRNTEKTSCSLSYTSKHALSHSSALCSHGSSCVEFVPACTRICFTLKRLIDLTHTFLFLFESSSTDCLMTSSR